jgi:hypothetical protein
MVDEVLQKFEDNTSLPMPSTLPSFREKRLQSSSYDNDKPHSLPYSPSVASEVATEKGASFSDGCQQHWSPAQSYLYIDKTKIDVVDNIDPDIIPPVDVAGKLLKLYQEAVHTPFCILDSQFEDQLWTYYRTVQRGVPMDTCPRWKAILNLVFAIGTSFSHLIGAVNKVDSRDHLVYMSRAVHFLGIGSIETFVGPPDNSLIQVTVLAHRYFLINR